MHHQLSLFTISLMAAAMWMTPVLGEERVRRGGWIEERDPKTGILVRTMEMTLHSRAEPRPALKYQLLPDDFDMLEGNAALYYLKAMGFLDQNSARDRLRDVFKEAGDLARKEKKDFGEVPPDAWQSMSPKELPLREVKEFLRLTSFQPQFLREAALRRRFDMDRNFRDADDPIGYLLPELQSMRELVRMQTLRCKVAIAEGRVNDAIAVLGQQYALARHLGQDEFLVSNLVGVACAWIAWDDALYLVQHPDAPNLFWAFASLPRPLVDIRHAMAVERQLFLLQLKVLREVDETPRPVGYWQNFLDRLVPQIGGLAGELSIPWAQSLRAWSADVKADADVEAAVEAVRAMLVAFVAAAYPGAKRYLIEEQGLPRDRIEAYPTAQVVFLALVRYYEETRDDYFKWSHLPYWQSQAEMRRLSSDQTMRNRAERLGWAAMPAQILLPAVSAVQTAVARIDQQLALVQTVEAIRMYGADHGGKLPASLDVLPVPVPLEPFTGKPFDYQFQGDHSVLNGHEMPGLRYRLILRFAKKAE